MKGVEFTEIRTYLIVTQEVVHSQFVQYDPKKWMEFHSKISKVDDILTERNIRHHKLTKEEVEEYCHRFMAFQFRHGSFSMTNFKASDEYLKIGGRIIRSFPLVDIDEINLPSVVKPYTQTNINDYGIANMAKIQRDQIADTESAEYKHFNDEYVYYMNRAQNYVKLFNPQYRRLVPRQELRRQMDHQR
mgnify:CR=1 FL=1